MTLPGSLGEAVAGIVHGRAYRELVPEYAPQLPASPQDVSRGVDGDEGLAKPNLAGEPRIPDESRGAVIYLEPPDVDRAAGKPRDVAYLLLEAILERHRKKESYLAVGELA